MMKRYFMKIAWISPERNYVSAEEGKRGEWVRYEDVQKLEEENKKLKEALESTLDIIDHEVDLRVLHPGSCGPNSPCDCDCQNKARLSTLIHEYKMLLKEMQ